MSLFKHFNFAGIILSLSFINATNPNNPENPARPVKQPAGLPVADRGFTGVDPV